MRYLLDSSVLIALVMNDHKFHYRASEWCENATHLAICPITEGALVRMLVRTGQPTAWRGALQTLYELDRFEFWPDDLSYADAYLHRIIGHQQVTDAYLVALAEHHGGKLATMDVSLAMLNPYICELIL